MDLSSNQGVFGALRVLETQSRTRRAPTPQPTEVTLLQRKVKMLTEKRERLKAELQAHQELSKARTRLDSECGAAEEQTQERSDVLELVALQTRLRDLLTAHHLVGGYDVVETNEGRGFRVSLATAYEGSYTDTFHLEVQLRPSVRLVRHDIPPFIPLSTMVQQHLQTDRQSFLSDLSRHLNAFAGRQQQLKLVQQLHPSVEVVETNLLRSVLVLVLPVPGLESGLLCSLEYSDLSKCLPTRVNLDCADQALPGSAQWKRNCSLLRDTPLHRALAQLKTTRDITE